MPTLQNASPVDRWLKIVLVVVLVLTLGKAVNIAFDPMTRLANGDNDDILRFLQVKAWLEGQGWFDARMYRLLAPEGLDLHWSRYVDLGIAVLVLPLSAFLPLDAALGLGIVLWPTLLFVALVLLTVRTAQRTFGSLTAIIAVCAIVMWQPIGQNYFLPTRIDHHNIQILLTTAMVFTLIFPGRKAVLGIVGGALAGFSLAIGLELLLTIALTGVVLALRAVFGREAQSTQFLAFCAAFAVSAALFFAGQNAPQVWTVSRCDVLSVPYLALTAMGSGVAVIYTLFARRIAFVGLRLGILVALSAGGVVLLLPLIEPCFSGPYGALPEDVKKVIYGSIIEARPALGPLLSGDKVTFIYIVPPLSAVLVTSGIWLWRTVTIEDRGGVQTRRLGTLLIFGWLGLLACLWQTRLILMGAAVYPLLVGVAVANLLELRKGKRASLATLGFIGVISTTLFAPTLQKASAFMSSGAPEGTSKAQRSADTCRDPDMLRSLSAIPSARIFAATNVTAPMMLVTEHIGLTGPYHRSPDAMADGIIPLYSDETTLRDALARTQADYLLLCRDATFWKDTGFATALAKGFVAQGLTPVDGLHEDLLLLAVDRTKTVD
ncbi:hypothetical protein SAMN05444000_12217 [Shimia gijangensis]|uniref:4-amino-4-deoxy-L-arabinose transferase n=1 Tax=Shimia gijangensis TaxID=1470563 RepID=A0A1M6QJD9_9RHOB|nr:hypothetical protein [Shimia gijangensis]SHK20389.1 hypothetical protein SAMN05444000_12217 [Shimia gijangensis]